MKEIKSDILTKFDKVNHGFIYGSGSNAEAEDHIKSKFRQVKTLRQIHSDTVIHFYNDDQDNNGHAGDAMYTAVESTCLAIYTADCVPVILFEPSSGAIGAVHAGWRGTVSGITLKTVRQMRDKLSLDTGGIVAVIGPGIGRCCYEVDHGVAEMFMSNFANHDNFVYTSSNGKYMVDLVEANKLQLRDCGIKIIEAKNMCTKCNGELPSYRRDGTGAGRILSYIGVV